MDSLLNEQITRIRSDLYFLSYMKTFLLPWKYSLYVPHKSVSLLFRSARHRR